MHAYVPAESMSLTAEGLVETLPVGSCSFLLRETVKGRRILDENALARSFIRRPLGQQIKEHRVVRFFILFLGRVRPIVAHTILSGAALTYACATLLVSA